MKSILNSTHKKWFWDFYTDSMIFSAVTFFGVAGWDYSTIVYNIYTPVIPCYSII